MHQKIKNVQSTVKLLFLDQFCLSCYNFSVKGLILPLNDTLRIEDTTDDTHSGHDTCTLDNIHSRLLCTRMYLY